MMDLYDTEQKVLDAALLRVSELRNGEVCSNEEFIGLVKEYASLLKQVRRITKISDRTTIDLNASNSDLLDKVHHDALTGIYNRRFLEDSLKRVVRSLSRSGEPLSVFMLDVDFFKRYNDTYGHSEGDECLKAIAQAVCKSLLRPDDYVARYGGEEFVVVLPKTGKKSARVMADRILESVRACKIPHVGNDAADYVTVSIGAVSDEAVIKREGELYIKRADDALYVSKRSGRNKCTFVEVDE